MKKTYRYIFLTRGRIAFVDWEDFDKLSCSKWCFGAGGYALSRHKGVIVYMHREILGTPDNLYTDHVNRNRLDNRKQNLRLATKIQNAANTGVHKDSISGLKGVSWHSRKQRWRARVNGKNVGYFKNPELAAVAYLKAATQKYGKYAAP